LRRRLLTGVEIAVVTLAAATLLREYFRKGRSREVRRQEITEPDGRKIVQVHEVQYLADGPLVRLLTRLGLSSQASG
jgi:hypothetical protein